MNRKDSRRKEKLEARGQTFTQNDVGRAVKTQLSPKDISDNLVSLLEKAGADIQREVNLTIVPGCPPAKDMILFVLDGTSPLAALAPPALRAQGEKAYAARLMSREQLINATMGPYPGLSEILQYPSPCGHLQFLVSTKHGGVVECTVCDLGLKPTLPS